MAKGSGRRRARPKAPVPVRSVQDLLDRLPEAALLQPPELRRGHERWRLLWDGTLRCLQAQEPGAYARVLAKLERHGLAGRQPAFKRADGALTAWERVGLASGVTDPEPSDRILEATRAYASDRHPVLRRGHRRPQRLTPRILLLMAYSGARWKVENEPAEQPRRRGESIELVAERYGLATDSARVLIRRARARVAPAMQRWIESIAKTPAHVCEGRTITPPGGQILWQVAMESELKT